MYKIVIDVQGFLADVDGYLKKMFDFVRHFDEEQDGEALKASIDKFLNK